MQIEQDVPCKIRFNCSNGFLLVQHHGISTFNLTIKVLSMSLSDTSSASQILITVIEIIGLLYAGFRFVNKITTRLEKLDEITDRLDALETQYKPNGGSSMRDAVNRIERQVEKLQDRLEHHIDNNRPN